MFKYGQFLSFFLLSSYLRYFLRLVPFVFTIVVIEEIIPLIVMYVPGMLPSTCVLPSQKARIEAKRHERQREAYSNAKDCDLLKDIDVESLSLKSLQDDTISLLCRYVFLLITSIAFENLNLFYFNLSLISIVLLVFQRLEPLAYGKIDSQSTSLLLPLKMISSMVKVMEPNSHMKRLSQLSGIVDCKVFPLIFTNLK